ncbi:hypothetical protein DL93DRAFT_2097659 [Clavulina sp. PMI_390]|nr:hypothetical protein DL93DRAFT_2097659 [Clavulina sp. PMI_390]
MPPERRSGRLASSRKSPLDSSRRASTSPTYSARQKDPEAASSQSDEDLDDTESRSEPEDDHLAQTSRQNATGPHQLWGFRMCHAFILACLEHEPWAAKHGKKLACWKAIREDVLQAAPGAHIVANQLQTKMKALLEKHELGTLDAWRSAKISLSDTEHISLASELDRLQSALQIYQEKKAADSAEAAKTAEKEKDAVNSFRTGAMTGLQAARRTQARNKQYTLTSVYLKASAPGGGILIHAAASFTRAAQG